MSAAAATLQQRVSDLIFSAKEHLKELEVEQNNSEHKYDEWQSAGEGELGEEDAAAHADEEPDVIDHSSKISAIESAIEHLETAVEKLDKAMADE